MREVVRYHGPVAEATFRIYGELGDFLQPERRGRAFTYVFDGRPSLKDAVEAIGPPHVEVALVLVDGEPADLNRPLDDGARVAVYPPFRRLLVPDLLDDPPPAQAAFLADAHLGKLARLLRLLGFDTVFARDAEDEAIARHAHEDGRILLTRDRPLLKRSLVRHGYWVRASDPMEQAQEVVRRYRLAEHARPFTRCLSCSDLLHPVRKEDVLPRIPPRVRVWRDAFLQCGGCGQLYWRGTHHPRLQATVARILDR